MHQLKLATELDHAAIDLQTRITQMVMLDDPEGVRAAQARARKSLTELQTIAGDLPSGRLEKLDRSISAAEQGLAALAAARTQEFTMRDRNGAALRKLKALSTGLEQTLDTRAQRAANALTSGGAATSAAVGRASCRARG